MSPTCTHRPLTAAIALTAAFGLAGADTRAYVPPPGPDTAPLVEANTAFALDLYTQLRERPGNLFLSPYSISTALAMTYAGARAQTAVEMAEVLHLDRVEPRVHPSFSTLAAAIVRADADAKEGLTLTTANRLWGGRHEEFLETFLDLVQDQYGGGFERVDFADLEKARKTINRWIEKRTNDKIRELLQKGDLGPGTALVLTNAIHFKGDWHTQFDPKRTRDLPFFLDTDREVDTPMMSASAHYGYHETEDLQMLELPYSGERLSMIVMLPKGRTGLADLERALTPERLAAWIDGLRDQKVQVFLPRFRMESRFSLADTLQGMGMETAFQGGAADFSGMNGRYDLFISKVIHQAFVDVNEEGTEAAAATAVVMARSSAATQRPPVFRADHPFVFVIRDRQTGTVLFMGRLADPGA